MELADRESLPSPFPTCTLQDTEPGALHERAVPSIIIFVLVSAARIVL